MLHKRPAFFCSLTARGALALCALPLLACGQAPHQPLDVQYAWRSDATFSDALASCAPAVSDPPCSLAELPLLNMEVEHPELDDIMGRVLVSDDWMGEHFEQVLETMPPIIYELFGATTAIVIGGHINPSRYDIRTGAIYLSLEHLWFTEGEKSQISQQDERAGYGEHLQLRSAARYVLDDAHIYGDYEPVRGVNDVRLPMAALLFHELAHAGDFFPPSQRTDIDPEDTVGQAAFKLSEQQLNLELTTVAPLRSETVMALADVLFYGATASTEQEELSAAQLGSLFETDQASDMYGYASPFEDLAMLFEESMMKRHFETRRDIAFLDFPGENADCDEFRIAWGAIDRIGDPAVKLRAQLICERLLPDEDFAPFFERLALPRMLPNVGWCESIGPRSLSTSPAATRNRPLTPRFLQHTHP